MSIRETFGTFVRYLPNLGVTGEIRVFAHHVLTFLLNPPMPMDASTPRLENVIVARERVCLDFVNTVDWRGSDHPEEHLHSFQDLIQWSEEGHLLSAPEAHHLLQQAAERPEDATRVFTQAIAARELLYRLFAAVVQGSVPNDHDLAELNTALSRAMAHACLVTTPTGFAWDYSGEKTGLAWMLHPLIRSAAEILVSEDVTRLQMCADPTCGWLFWDTSRNHSRRWCAMKDCGNRAKARRFYRRKHHVRK